MSLELKYDVESSSLSTEDLTKKLQKSLNKTYRTLILEERIPRKSERLTVAFHQLRAMLNGHCGLQKFMYAATISDEAKPLFKLACGAVKDAGIWES